VVSLFGHMCDRERQSPGALPHGLASLDVGGVREHLDWLMGSLDLSCTNEDGHDVLSFLATHIVVNAQCYTDWSAD